jgi:hypothetical protein
MATLQEFRNEFKGVRANRFRVRGSIMDTGRDGTPENFEFYCKAASVPGSVIGVIPVGYKGRPIKFSGERSYTDWIVQVYDSSTKDLRKRFDDWIQKMDQRNNHEINYNVASKNWIIDYMDMTGTSSNSQYQRSIKLINCFPVDVSPIALDYDTPDTFAQFTVTLTYDYWEYAGQNGGGTVIS